MLGHGRAHAFDHVAERQLANAGFGRSERGNPPVARRVDVKPSPGRENSKEHWDDDADSVKYSVRRER